MLGAGGGHCLRNNEGGVVGMENLEGIIAVVGCAEFKE
jgi:hypothetical protein